MTALVTSQDRDIQKTWRSCRSRKRGTFIARISNFKFVCEPVWVYGVYNGWIDLYIQTLMLTLNFFLKNDGSFWFSTNKIIWRFEFFYKQLRERLLSMNWSLFSSFEWEFYKGHIDKHHYTNSGFTLQDNERDVGLMIFPNFNSISSDFRAISWKSPWDRH